MGWGRAWGVLAWAGYATMGATLAWAEPDGSMDFSALEGTALDDPAFRAASVGVHVVRVDDGATLVDWRADQLMVPASTMKVVTSAAALDALGPSYTFRTEAYADGEIVDGVLAGDLYLRGGGDPTLSVQRVWRLLRDLRVDGLLRVDGDLVLDDSFFDDPPAIPGWDNPRDLEDGPSYFPPIGALQTEFGAAVLVLRPGSEPGQPATVSFETPADRYLTVDGEVTTGPARSRTRIELAREVRGDRLVFTVGGSLPVDADVRRFRRAVHDPTAFFAGVVASLLDDVGPGLKGKVRPGVLPEGASFLRRQYSPPLASVLMDTNKYSSNFMAESVLRTLGAERRGEGTNAAGLDVVREYLGTLGIAAGDVVLANGSGLSRDTRLSARHLTTVLRDMATATQGPELLASLSIAGQDGTLRSRMRDVAVGSVRGKTGTLSGVHTLAGYVRADDGSWLAFAFLANDVRGSLSKVKRVMDAFLLEQKRAPGVADSP